jgi:HPt (histidine-containing phosphotransfer) domain-containing protein
MDDYLAKPLSTAALAETLTKWGLRKPEPAPPTDARLSQSPQLPRPEGDAGNRAEPPVFAELGLVSRVAGDLDLARAIMRGFLSDAPDRVDTLVHDILAGDTKHAEYLAHTLKGAALALGGESFAEMAAALEAMAKGGDQVAMRSRMGELRERFACLHAAVGASSLLAAGQSK